MAYELDLVRDEFDPEKAREEMGIICTALFQKFPVKKEEGVQYCESDWDSFLCWLATPVGQVLSQPCPPFGQVLIDGFNATRKCLRNGTWEISDYRSCMKAENMQHHLDNYDFFESEIGVTVIYYIGYSITIVALIIALAIFGYFRSLRCLRNIIHCNLLCAFLLNGVVWLFLHNAVEKLYLYYPKLCTSVVIFANYIHAIPFYWMFIEGLYLFTFIVWAFSAEKVRLWYYLLFGWCAPIIPTAVWAGIKLHKRNENCLLIPDMKYDIIYHGPVLLLLALNVFFITAIIWVLVTKLRASNTLETRQSRKAAKATVVLFPLLGVTYIFFIKAPTQTKELHWIFTHVNAVLQAFQGLFVAIIYCFLNGEVKSLVRLKVSALQDSRTLSRYTRSSFFGSPRRSSCYAMTTTTYNGKNTLVPAGATGATVSTAVSGSISNLASASEVSKAGHGEETSVMVVSGDLWPPSNRTDERQQKGEVLYSAEGETEASEAMMENML
ncbi:hypothetical protein RRG08_009100 [Elysia crispata]|uniref:Uncharacterized protein n=1 Tax=Elysia crispata TaxID=231223 RepID=A0AAE0YYB1_9GAST|nr:hypothetical protein RRG08_009100 [Elysia crispata]